MKVLSIVLLVVMAGLSCCFANDPAAAQAKAATEAETAAFNEAWNKSYQEAVALYPDAADENSELTKAVRADIEAIRIGPNPQLLGNPALPMILVQKHAARLGISPKSAAGGAESMPAVRDQADPPFSADDEARIVQLTLAGMSRARAELLVMGSRRAAADPQTQLKDQARTDQLRDEQRRMDDTLARERRQAELDRDRIEQQRLDQQRFERQLRDERLRREREEAERQRARDRD